MDDDIDMVRLLTDICSEAKQGGKIRVGYSGRGMYGSQCYGIVTDDHISVIENAGAAGLFNAQTDSMGRQTIVYWPAPQFSDDCVHKYYKEPEEEDEEEE